MRRGINIDPNFPEGIEFSIARSPEEIKAACAMLYDAYTDAGFMIADGSGYRFTVYHALPYCYTLIVKQNQEIIATVTLIIRSVEDLPIEKVFSLNPYLGFGRRVVEVSALTVHPRARDNRGRGRILFPLFKYLYKFAAQQLGATDLVITCNPKHLAFYKSIMLFETISDKTEDSYDFVDGAPAVAARLDLTTTAQRYDEIYGGKPLNKNLSEYIFFSEFPQFSLPDEADTVYIGNCWTPEQLTWMLETMSLGRSKLSQHDMSMLCRAYGSSYEDVFAQFGFSTESTARVDLNVETIIAGDETRVKARILAVSGEEICLSIKTNLGLKCTSPILELIEVGDDCSIPLGVGRPLGHDEYVFQIEPSGREALLNRYQAISSYPDPL